MNQVLESWGRRYCEEWKHGHVDIDDLSNNVTAQDVEKIMTDFLLFVKVDIEEVRLSVRVLSAQCGNARIRTPNQRRIMNFIDSAIGEPDN
jgi:hypothetical protein